MQTLRNKSTFACFVCIQCRSEKLLANKIERFVSASAIWEAGEVETQHGQDQKYPWKFMTDATNQHPCFFI